MSNYYFFEDHHHAEEISMSDFEKAYKKFKPSKVESHSYSSADIHSFRYRSIGSVEYYEFTIGVVYTQ